MWATAGSRVWSAWAGRVGSRKPGVGTGPGCGGATPVVIQQRLSDMAADRGGTIDVASVSRRACLVSDQGTPSGWLKQRETIYRDHGIRYGGAHCGHPRELLCRNVEWGARRGAIGTGTGGRGGAAGGAAGGGRRVVESGGYMTAQGRGTEVDERDSRRPRVRSPSRANAARALRVARVAKWYPGY